MENIFLGVSGGVDSFVSALLLKNQGYDVTGVYLDMGLGDIVDTEKLSEKLDIEILKVDASGDFGKHVLKHFTETYMDGGVPSPCVECNKYVKWKYLLDTAGSLGGGYIATGHYCNVAAYDGIYYIEKGRDTVKDQSYYLWKLGQDVLSRAIFPLGKLLKEEVRNIALKNGYTGDLQKKESMGLCFMRNQSLKDFLTEREKAVIQLKGGEIVDKSGNVIGIHDGYPFYTLAQKKGLGGINGCVTKIDKEKNRIVMGEPEDLYTRTIRINNLHVNSYERLKNCKELKIKVRGIGQNPSESVRMKLYEDEALIELSDPAWAVTTGQPVVFYENNTVLGGGEAL